jgi:adenylate kinase family enzyme
MIIGQPGSGKSRLARELGALTGLPVVHMDRIHWQCGWRERTTSEKAALCLAVHAREQWVFEGIHTATSSDRLARCDTVIWLDYPFALRFRRIIWRLLIHYGRARPDMPAGCPERFDRAFLIWVWNTRHSARETLRSFFAAIPEGKVRHYLDSDAAVARFLDELAERYHGPSVVEGG